MPVIRREHFNTSQKRIKPRGNKTKIVLTFVLNASTRDLSVVQVLLQLMIARVVGKSVLFTTSSNHN